MTQTLTQTAHAQTGANTGANPGPNHGSDFEDAPDFAPDGAPALEAQLRTALAAPGVAPDLATRGARLLARLTRPVQVVVVGDAGCGKSAVIDMLLGTQVAGLVNRLALVELAYGAEPQVRFEDANGDGALCPGTLGDYEIPPGTLSARQMLPLPMLKSLHLTEITLAGDLNQRRTLLRHAVEYGDVILWCSPAFETDEQTLWAEVPERKRDNGFLVLTLADQQIMRGSLPETVARLAPVVEESFWGLYPVAARQGLQAKGGAPGADRQLWRACGGQRLAEDLRRRVAQGRQATQDQAEALLWQLTLPDPAQATGQNPVSVPAPDPAPRSHSRPHTQQPPEAAPQPNPSENRGAAVLEQALGQLQSQAEAMLADAGDDPKSAKVLDHCLLAVRDMAEVLVNAPGDGPALKAAREASQDGEEMVMLLQLEQDEEAAVDAVTLLLQLKKELSDPALPAKPGVRS
ncbi:hypothetical protein GFB49_11150 [Epibacterium sp. SM1979]|uniref:Dynamin family protein n=1 Tax=Tritonibacter litoralis TaxID=2662264 RepID=A0A843YIC0_9RHOB|nr:hypothetical protein [Tritonibacter litoralis]MQQ09012.1 hypothetical protein [Tritonibacter litoralis]